MTDEEVAAQLAPSKPHGALTDDDVLRMAQASTDIPVGVAAPLPEPSVGDRILGAFKGAGRTLKGAAEAAGSAIAHPLDTIRDPSRRREFERGLDNMLTFGVGQRIASAVDPSFGQSAALDAETAPGFQALGGISALALGKRGGATGQLMGLGNAVSRAFLPVAAGGGLAGAALGAARGVAGYEASAPFIAGGQAAVRGENPIEAARAAATDPVGLSLAGVGGAVTGGAAGKATAIRDPNTPSGRIIADIEAAGPGVKITKRGESARGGLFEKPEMQAHPLDRQGNIKFAGESVDRSIHAADARYEAAQEAWGKKAGQILAEHHPDEIYKADTTHGVLDAIENDNTVNGVAGDEGIAKAVGKVRRMLTSQTDEVDPVASANAGKVIYKTEPGGTISDIMKTRKMLNRLARKATEPADRFVYGEVLDSLAEDAAAIDPRIGELNGEYRAAMQKLTAANDAMFGQAKPYLRDTEAARAAAAGRMSRVGDPTQAGPLADMRLDRFANAAPENAAELRMMRARKAATRLNYGEPETSTSFEKGISRGVERGAHKAAAAVVGHALAGPVGAALAYPAGEALSNLSQAKIRLGLPALESIGQGTGVRAGIAGNQASGLDLLLQARALEADLAARRAAALGGR